MGLFTTVAVAAAFKLKAATTSDMITDDVVEVLAPTDPYGTVRNKNELAKRAPPGDFEVFRLTMPILKNGTYKDFPDYDTGTAIKAVMDIIGEIDEIKLLGKKEWMEEWDSTDERLVLGDIEGEFEEETITNYFQSSLEKTQFGEYQENQIVGTKKMFSK